MLCAALVLLTSPALAQDAPAEPSERQWTLNNEGLDALKRQDYATAIDLFEQALAVGELNLFHLNLGRALQKAGRCEEAERAFEDALDAPAVPDPTPEQIASAIDRFRGPDEIGLHCPGTLILTCKPSTLEVFLDGQSLGKCPLNPIRLPPGAHRILGAAFDITVEKRVAITGGQRTELTLTIDTPAKRRDAEKLIEAGDALVAAGKLDEAVETFARAEALTPGWALPKLKLAQTTDKQDALLPSLKWYSQYLPFSTDKERPEIEARIADIERRIEAASQPSGPGGTVEPRDDTLAWLLVGGGGVAVGIGLIVDLVPDSGSNGQLDGTDFIPVAVYAIGLAAITTGAILLLDGESPPPTATDTPAADDTPLSGRFYLGPEAGWRSPIP